MMTKYLPLKPLSFLFIALFLLQAPAKAQRKATILDHKDRVRLTPLSVLNSSARETNLSITPDGKYLYFMSLRGGQSWSRKYMVFSSDSVYDGDIWYSQKIGGEWQRPRCLPYGINTGQGEDEPNVSADGRRVYFQSWNYLWGETGGPYYQAQREGRTWSKKRGLGGGITEFFKIYIATDGMSISPDERRFVVAAGPEYNGNMNLYMSTKGRYGWTYCRRLPISTRGNERSAFIAADGKTIYFASDGYDGYGGLDIYKSTLINDSTFGEVINIGAPFNTPKDDYGFILTGDGNEAYFVRDGDIYFADLKEADERIKPTIPEVHLVLKGSVRDKDSWKGIKAEIMLLDAYTKRIIKRFETDSKGQYQVELPNKDRLYDQIVIADGYPKSRRRLSVQKKYRDETISANFLLEAEEPEAPPIAEAKTTPTPPPPEPPVIEPEKDPVVVQPVKPTIKDEAVPPAVPIKPPAAVKVEPPEDPYSFEGVAENNLILLLDVSASMKKPEKLPLLKESLVVLLQHMRPEDQISVVVYSGDARVVLDGVSAARKQTIIDAIDNLRSSGSTKGKEALRKAYRIAEDNYIPSGNNRIIMATDGDFDVESLYNIAEKKADDSAISLTVFSFGKLPQHKIEELARLAQLGRGNFANIAKGNVDQALLTEAKAVRR
jgi:uncharacterized protein YegL